MYANSACHQPECHYSRGQRCALVEALSATCARGQYGRQSVMCHLAELHVTQVEGDNIVPQTLQLNHQH